MFIAIELEKLLKEKEDKKMDGVAVKAICQETDTMTVQDHIWLNSAAMKLEFMDAIRTGNTDLDAGMTAGILLGQNTDGILVTDSQILIGSESANNDKCSIQFVPGLKEALALYRKKMGEKPEKKRKPRKAAEELPAARPSTDPDVVLPGTPETEEEHTVDLPVEEKVETTANEAPTAAEFPMPSPEETPAAPVESTEIPPAPTESVEDEQPWVPDDFAATAVIPPTTPAPQFSLKDQKHRENALKFDEGQVPEGPEFEQWKKLAISNGIANAYVLYGLTAFQISDTADDLMHSLVKVFGGFQTEARTIYDQTKEHFAELKNAADQVAAFDVFVME